MFRNADHNERFFRMENTPTMYNLHHMNNPVISKTLNFQANCDQAGAHQMGGQMGDYSELNTSFIGDLMDVKQGFETNNFGAQIDMYLGISLNQMNSFENDALWEQSILDHGESLPERPYLPNFNYPAAPHSAPPSSNSGHHKLFCEIPRREYTPSVPESAQECPSRLGTPGIPNLNTKTYSPEISRIVDVFDHGSEHQYFNDGVKVVSPCAKNQCSICGKQFKRISSLKTHYHSHTGEKKHQCPWKNCGKRFNVKSNMTRHYKLHLR